MAMKKLIPYLLLNIAVSAVTMLGVILIWNAFHPSVAFINTIGELSATQSEIEVSDLPPLAKKTIEIESVFMPGEVDYEKVSLKNVGAEPVDLSGWFLSNGQGEKFFFPAITLYPNGALDVYSHAGVNTAVELFCNRSDSLWTAGDRAVLQDSAGNERSSYPIP